MFSTRDIFRVENREGYRKCLIIPGFLQYPDFYEEEAREMPYRIVDIVNLRWDDREMARDNMQLEFISGLYVHICREKYDTIYVHGISDSIVYKLKLFGALNQTVVFINPYCIPDEERGKHYKLLRLYLRLRDYIPIKIQLLLFKRAIDAEDDYFALYLLNSMKSIKAGRVLKRFEDSLVSCELTEELEGIFVYGEDDKYSWPIDEDNIVQYAGHYPLNEEFTKTMHKVEMLMMSEYEGGRRIINA